MKLVHWSVLIAAFSGMACGGSTEIGPSDVVGEIWQLVSLQQSGAPPTTVPSPSRYTLQFGDDGRVAVMADCNACSGTYSMNGSSIDIGVLACTRAFCGDASLDAEYLSVLDGATSIAVSDSELTLRGANGTARFRN